MAKSRQQKSASKDRLVDLFKKAVAVAFVDYQGLTVPKADKLRKLAAEQDVAYMVAKKTLINLAAKEAGLELDARQMPGMIGVAFGLGDEVAPAKIMGDMSKDTPLKLMGGVFGGKVVDRAYVTALSKLPGRQQLYGMLVSVIAGPMSGLVRVLDAVRKQKETATA